MSFPSTVEHGTQRPWLIALATAAGIGVAASIVGFIAAVIGVSTVTETSGVTPAVLATAGVRTILTVAVLIGGVVLGCLFAARGDQRWWAAVSALGLVLDIWAWGGNALFTAAVLSGGAEEQSLIVRIIGFVVDLVIWVVVGWVAAGFGLRLGEKRLSGVQRLH